MRLRGNVGAIEKKAFTAREAGTKSEAQRKRGVDGAGACGDEVGRYVWALLDSDQNAGHDLGVSGKDARRAIVGRAFVESVSRRRQSGHDTKKPFDAVVEGPVRERIRGDWIRTSDHSSFRPRQCGFWVALGRPFRSTVILERIRADGRLHRSRQLPPGSSPTPSPIPATTASR